MTSESTDAGAMDGIELADAVESIRNQLIDAASRATGRPVAFEPGATYRWRSPSNSARRSRAAAR